VIRQKKKRMMSYSLVIMSMLTLGVAIGSFTSNPATITHTISPFSPVLSLLINGVVDFGERVLFIAVTQTPPPNANVASESFTWTSTTITGPHNLVMTGTAVTGGFTLADLVVDCGAGPIVGTNPSAIIGEYIVSIDATVDGSLDCTYSYGGGPRTINWSSQIVTA